jgi:hypothetical protein
MGRFVYCAATANTVTISMLSLKVKRFGQDATPGYGPLGGLPADQRLMFSLSRASFERPPTRRLEFRNILLGGFVAGQEQPGASTPPAAARYIVRCVIADTLKKSLLLKLERTSKYFYKNSLCCLRGISLPWGLRAPANSKSVQSKFAYEPLQIKIILSGYFQGITFLLSHFKISFAPCRAPNRRAKSVRFMTHGVI